MMKEETSGALCPSSSGKTHATSHRSDQHAGYAKDSLMGEVARGGQDDECWEDEGEDVQNKD